MTNYWIKVEKTKTCWIWKACTDGKGYGVFHVPGTKGQVTKAYKVSYEIEKGPVPAGYDIDHLCKNKICVNPDHLEAVPHRENVLRGNSFMAIKARQTHCIRGHEYTEKNTARHHGRRTCRECTYTPEFREKRKLYIREVRARNKAKNSHPLPPDLTT